MEEKIIIDGVDVTECKHYKIGTCVADYLLTDMNFSEAKCNLCPNCYYKQLKRLEQENEELKRKYEENKTVILQLQQWQYEDLRQIAELKRIKDDFFKQAEISHEAVLNKNKIIEKLEKEEDKYKYSLEEIKGTIKHFKTYFSEKELNKVKFSDITVIEEIINEAIGE